MWKLRAFVVATSSWQSWQPDAPANLTGRASSRCTVSFQCRSVETSARGMRTNLVRSVAPTRMARTIASRLICSGTLTRYLLTGDADAFRSRPTRFAISSPVNRGYGTPWRLAMAAMRGVCVHIVTAQAAGDS